MFLSASESARLLQFPLPDLILCFSLPYASLCNIPVLFSLSFSVSLFSLSFCSKHHSRHSLVNSSATICNFHYPRITKQIWYNYHLSKQQEKEMFCVIKSSFSLRSSSNYFQRPSFLFHQMWNEYLSSQCCGFLVSHLCLEKYSEIQLYFFLWDVVKKLKEDCSLYYLTSISVSVLIDFWAAAKGKEPKWEYTFFLSRI